MFDFHAHPGDDNRDAFITILKEDEIGFITDRSSIGLLPWLDMMDREMIENLIKENSSLMVGEFGLDKFKGDKDKDMDSFLFMAMMARSYDRLAVIHSVRYTDLILKKLKEMGIKRAIFHSYSGSYEMARDIERAGYMISLSPRSFMTRDIERLLKLDFLLETDERTGEKEKTDLLDLYQKAQMITGIDPEERLERRKREIWQENSYV